MVWRGTHEVAGHFSAAIWQQGVQHGAEYAPDPKREYETTGRELWCHKSS